MPFRKPLGLQVFSAVDEGEEDEDGDDESVAASVGSAVSRGSLTDASIKKSRSESEGDGIESPDNLSALTSAMQLRESYEDTSPEQEGSKKRGRGPLKRQTSFEVTENMYTGTVAFNDAKAGVRLKQDGMRDGRGQQVSNISYDQLDNVKVLGRGATSKVWLKVHKATGRKVAVKELSAMVSDDMRRMAVNELKIAHKHAHQQYLVNFIDAFFADGKIAIAMEYCDGGSLEGVVKAARPHGGVAPAPLGAITVQYLRGLQYLHREMKQVHRDLKPAK